MSEFVTVDIPQGRLRGKTVTSNASGVTYYSFQGIPYAKPPLGPLRFKPPEEPETWSGTREATLERPVAPQYDFISKKVLGEEDCLFINVYTPQVLFPAGTMPMRVWHASMRGHFRNPGPDSREKIKHGIRATRCVIICATTHTDTILICKWPATSPKAVMVWIHGGAFILGSGNTAMYGPDFLVAEDVVLVTLNYRLGALGFLYLDEADVTGNNGLRDQVMALKWVKMNIAHFGGDPGNVTIFGESAGGTSVHYLMLSPLAAGLFHRAIAQSGSALIGAANTPCDVSNQRAVRIAKFLGCTSDDPQRVVDFLRTVPPEKLIAHQQEALSEEEKDRLEVLLFYPTEEIGHEAFLPASPRNLISEGKFSKVPFMTGVTSAEGKIMLFEMYLHTALSEIDKHFENVLPPDLVPRLGTETSKEIANVIKKFYFGECHLGDDTSIQYIDMMSDLMFVYPQHKTIQSQTKWSPHPTYVYLFDHINESGINVLTSAVDNIPGATHAAELPYLFRNTFWSINFSPGSADAQVRTKCVQLWTQFAKTGNPSSDAANVTWIPATKGKSNYLKINGGFNMDTDMYTSRMNFLEELYSRFLH